MLRRYHRWLAVVFGIFLLWISATGLLSHGAALYRDSQPAPVAAAPAGFVCPKTMTCRPKPAPDSAAAWVSFFHHIHAGEEFGPAGTAASILSGFALFFFAFSGLWMYLQMFRARTQRQRAGQSKWFWK
ncbi:PepSY domain-containing protein [Sphingomonas sp.]|uniref:PepSY domain-containing protein n=1 Tax=Sphingomonas sp. TaxID=28214 RepID=UPI00286E00C2|nr:PepSY domain-containing protein [Sphingomonas sp.]